MRRVHDGAHDGRGGSVLEDSRIGVVRRRDLEAPHRGRELRQGRGQVGASQVGHALIDEQGRRALACHHARASLTAALAELAPALRRVEIAAPDDADP